MISFLLWVIWRELKLLLSRQTLNQADVLAEKVLDDILEDTVLEMQRLVAGCVLFCSLWALSRWQGTFFLKLFWKSVAGLFKGLFSFRSSLERGRNNFGGDLANLNARKVVCSRVPRLLRASWPSKSWRFFHRKTLHLITKCFNLFSKFYGSQTQNPFDVK